jgi:hypothetical protein
MHRCSLATLVLASQHHPLLLKIQAECSTDKVLPLRKCASQSSHCRLLLIAVLVVFVSRGIVPSDLTDVAERRATRGIYAADS